MLSEPPGADPHAGWCGSGQGEPGLYQFDVAAEGNPGPVGSAARTRTPPADPTKHASNWRMLVIRPATGRTIPTATFRSSRPGPISAAADDGVRPMRMRWAARRNQRGR